MSSKCIRGVHLSIYLSNYISYIQPALREPSVGFAEFTAADPKGGELHNCDNFTMRGRSIFRITSAKRKLKTLGEA
jgi:hypothetical protein